MVDQDLYQRWVWTIFVYCNHHRAFFSAFLACGGHSAQRTTPIKKCSCQRTTKGVNNALMQAFLLEHPIGGGRLSTMGWMVPKFGEGWSIGDSGSGCVFFLILALCLVHLFLSGNANTPVRKIQILQKYWNGPPTHYDSRTIILLGRNHVVIHNAQETHVHEMLVQLGTQT
jgi:hypothetical protein